MRYLALILLLACGSAAAQRSPPPPLVLVQPNPFAAGVDYPDIPGVCIVPAWEYPAADTDRDGIVEPDELKRYCRKIDRARVALQRNR